MVENSKNENPNLAEIAEATFKPLETMNRAQRRELARKKKRLIRTKQGVRVGGRKLGKIDDLIDDERGLNHLEKDLSDYVHAQDFTKYRFSYFKLWMDCGLTEQTARRFLDPDSDRTSLQVQAMMELNPGKHNESKRQFSHLEKIVKGLQFYQDDEEVTILRNMGKNDLSVDEVFRETLRARQASIDLIQMQIDYLRHQEEEVARKKMEDEQLAQLISEEERRKDTELTTESVVEQSVVELQLAEVKKPFPLADWKIYWTNRFWSDNPNHLTQIDTNDRDVALHQIETIAGHEISVGTGSVLRALEFHLLDRDKIQRALATRNKYAPGEIRRWVKVKRGKDRIGILVDEEKPKTAIFFVGGRDVVYRGL